jgi:hypothetical protein
MRETNQNLMGAKRRVLMRETNQNLMGAKRRVLMRETNQNLMGAKRRVLMSETNRNLMGAKRRVLMSETNRNLMGAKRRVLMRETNQNLMGAKRRVLMRETNQNLMGAKRRVLMRETNQNLMGAKQRVLRAGAFRFLLLMVPLLGSLGCAEFDQQGEILDLRVVGMKVTPPEIMYGGFYLFTEPEMRPPGFLPEYEVELEILAFDPRGGDITSSLRFCPEGAGNCLDYDPEDDILARFEEDDARLPELREAYGTVERDHAAADRLVDGAGQIKDTTYTINFTEAVVDTVLRDRNGNPALDVFSKVPRFVIDIDNKDFTGTGEVEGEVAFKRFPFTLDYNDPNLPPDVLGVLLDILGLELCDEGFDPETFEEGVTDCFLARGANENPTLVGFDFVDVEAEAELLAEARNLEEQNAIRPPIFFGTESDIKPRARLRLNPGDDFTLRPVFPPGTRQPYQVFGFDVDASTLTLENRYEDIVISWYTQHGSAPDLASTLLGSVLDTTYTAPGQGRLNQIRGELGLDADDPVLDTLIGVVRDQRGGQEFIRIDIEFREDNPSVTDPNADNRPFPFNLLPEPMGG